MINPNVSNSSRTDNNFNGPVNNSTAGSGRFYLVPEDFVPLVQDVVDTHPGLTFLKEAAEFHSRYVHTVRNVDFNVSDLVVIVMCLAFSGDCANLLQREPVLVGANHVGRVAPFQPIGDDPSAGRGRRHQPNHRFLQLRAFLRHLLQVLGVGQGPRPLYRQKGSGPAQRSRYSLGSVFPRSHFISFPLSLFDLRQLCPPR